MPRLCACVTLRPSGHSRSNRRPSNEFEIKVHEFLRRDGCVQPPFLVKFSKQTYSLGGSEIGLNKSPKLFIDRKSTRLNSSHGYISYAVFCLKKKKTS